jgi:Leu/Phe-tRNA-protein transferase
MASIRQITPPMLEEEVLHTHIYPDLEHEFYWDDSWDPTFYVDLARAGFISIAHPHPDVGPLLLPQIQTSYAVLDWENLHYSRNLRRLLRSDRLAREDIELRVGHSVERVLERIFAYHEHRWILDPYAKLLRKLPTTDPARFAIHGIELWSRERDALVAGELGYTIGRTYTSLTGFCSRDDRELRHFGTLQMVLLAERLRDRGYAFWNLGHPDLPYKQAIGAQTVPRAEFLERWLASREGEPTAGLSGTLEVGSRPASC